MASSTKLLETGVPGLDFVLGGGLPERQVTLVTGVPGTGKTVLTSQLGFHFARKGLHVLYATVTAESNEKLISDLEDFEFFQRNRLGEEFFLLSLYASLKTGGKETRELLLQSVRKRQARVLIIDGLRAMRDLWGQEYRVREFLYDLNIALRAADCSAIISSEYRLEALNELSESTNCDCILSLTRAGRPDKSLRQLEVVKLRGRNHVAGFHSMRISREGVRVIPRAESYPRLDRDLTKSHGRLGFGIPSLDEQMEGGLPNGSTTLVAGSSGTGKTLLALYFLAEGARRNEPGLFYSFTEPPGTLLARGERLGMNLRPLVEAGTLKLFYPPPPEADADELAQSILGALQEDCRRVVLDGIGDFEQTVSRPDRLGPFFSAFIMQLRFRGVTSLFTRQVSRIVGPELNFSDTPLAHLAENLLFTRRIELRGQLPLALSILSMRDSGFDGSIRRLQISPERGLEVLEVIDSAAGLLTGLTMPLSHREDSTP